MPNDTLKPNPQLIKELRDALALAEQGKVTDGAICCIGKDVAHHSFAASTPAQMIAVLGELGVFKAGLENMVITNRMQEQQDRAAGIVGRSRLM